MKKIYLSAFALVFGMITFSNAQTVRSCATMQHLEMQMKNDPGLVQRMQKMEVITQQNILQGNSLNRTTAVITIPVVVHVLYNTSSQNISDAQVQSQIDVLNEDYHKLNADAANTPSVYAGLVADCQIQFCLAQRDPNGLATNGIIHKSTTKTSFSSNDGIKSNSTGGDNAWNSSQYLNIWVGNLGGGLLGYAQFPGGAASTDGVVILYSAFGRVGNVNAPYNKGRSATHEVGHWLNLRHIWGDANCGDDLVSDTPTQQTSNFGCPAFPQVTCSNTTGDMTMNYMDYTDDPCMYMFSNGQSARMNSAINTYRSGLLTSSGCVPPASVCSIPSGLSSSAITSTSATLSWTAVSGATSYNVQYRITGAGSWSSTTISGTSISVSGLTASSNYEFQVQTVCSSGSSSFSGSSTFTTSSGTITCGIPSSLTTSAITSSSSTISWGAVSGASSYNIQYRIVGSPTWIFTTSSINSKALAGLTASSNYEFQVQTICSSGSGSFSNSGNFTTAAVTSGCSDIYEPNNSRTAAATIAVNTDVNGFIGTSTDKDYYKVVTVAGSTKLKVVLDQLPGDYDLKLLNANGATLVTSQNAGTTSEQIIKNATTAATYYVYIYGYNGANSSTTCYHLKVYAGSVNFREGELSVSTLNTEKVNGIDGLSLYPNPASDKLGLNFFITNHADVKANIIDMLGKTVMNENISAEEGFNQSAINLSSLNNGIYFLQLQQNDQMIVKKFIVKH